MRRRLKKARISLVLLSAVATLGLASGLSYSVLAQTSLTAPQDVRVFDTPSDGGESLTVQWAPAPGDGPDIRYQVLAGDASTTDPQNLAIVAEFPSNSKYVKDVKTAWWTRTAEKTWHQTLIKSAKGFEIKNDQPYAVAMATVQGDQRVFSAVYVASPAANWFNWNQLNNLIIAISFGGLVFCTISHAKRHEIFLRRIPGLDAVDEAIGRATEGASQERKICPIIAIPRADRAADRPR